MLPFSLCKKDYLNMQFNLEEAMQNLLTVCREFKGTAAQHEYLKFCLDEIYKKLKPEPQEKKPFDPKDHIKPVPVPNAEG
jgi:hypothetical protein